MSDKRPLNEGKVQKGGQNKPPSSPRPKTPPPPQPPTKS